MVYSNMASRAGAFAFVIGIFAVFIAIGIFLTFPQFRGLFTTSGPITGGTATSLSYVTLFSNYAQFNDPVWLASITLNGRGQNLTGFSAKTLNSSYPSGTAVSITTSSTYGYDINYQSSPAFDLYTWNVAPVPNIVSGYSCPFGIACAETLYPNNGVDGFGMAWINTGSNPVINVFPNIEASYIHACNGAGGSAILLGQGGIGGSTYGATWECVQFLPFPVAQVYESSYFTNAFNATITVKNNTRAFTGSINNNDQQTTIRDRNGNPQAIINLVSYSDSGFNINQQTIPWVLGLLRTGKYVIVNPSTIPSLVQGAESPSLPSGALAGAGTVSCQNFYPCGTLYSNTTIYNVQQLDQQVIGFAYAPPPYSQYASMNISGFYNKIPVGKLNLTADPTFYADIQVLAKFYMLGIGFPVAMPVITGVSPQPLNAGSASAVAAVFTVYNNATVSAPAIISGSCGGNAFASPSFSAGPQASTNVQVLISSPLNPSNSTTPIKCQAQASSSNGGVYVSPIFYFTMNLNGACQPGTIYVNPDTCKPIPPQISTTTVCQTATCAVQTTTATTTVFSCRQGYSPLANGTCIPTPLTCASNQTLIYNSTFNAFTCQTEKTPPNWLLIAAIIGFTAIIAAILGYGALRRRRYA